MEGQDLGDLLYVTISDRQRVDTHGEGESGGRGGGGGRVMLERDKNLCIYQVVGVPNELC